MTGGHEHHTGGAHPLPGGPVPTAVAVALLAALAVAYLLLVRRTAQHRTAKRWSPWRTASFLTGCALVAGALLPPLGAFAHGDFRGHMAQHLLIGMYAPLGLVLGAPVTLLLRTLPPARARQLTVALRSRPLQGIAHPVTALVLSTGSLAVLYGTPLYDVTAAHPALHWLVHAHFLLSGCLFAWVVAGPDPAPARPGVPARLVLLGVAVALHATFSQLLYGGFLIGVHAPVDQVRGGAELMYYGGDLAELLLAGALVATWRPARGPRRTAGARPQPLSPTESLSPP